MSNVHKYLQILVNYCLKRCVPHNGITKVKHILMEHICNIYTSLEGTLCH